MTKFVEFKIRTGTMVTESITTESVVDDEVVSSLVEDESEDMSVDELSDVLVESVASSDVKVDE